MILPRPVGNGPQRPDSRTSGVGNLVTVSNCVHTTDSNLESPSLPFFRTTSPTPVTVPAYIASLKTLLLSLSILPLPPFTDTPVKLSILLLGCGLLNLCCLGGAAAAAGAALG